jgi:hypothetical protein
MFSESIYSHVINVIDLFSLHSKRKIAHYTKEGDRWLSRELGG